MVSHYKLPAGFEPATYALRMRRSTSWAKEAILSILSFLKMLMTSPGIEPGFTPWEGVVLTAWPRGLILLIYLIITNQRSTTSGSLPKKQEVSRGDKIWTCDLCVPNAALYQTEPRLDFSSFLSFCFCSRIELLYTITDFDFRQAKK